MKTTKILSRWINRSSKRRMICGGLIPTRTTNHWPSDYFSLHILGLIFCRSHVSLGEHSEQSEEARLVIPIPMFASVIGLSGWHVDGLSLPTVTIPGRRGGSPYLSNSPEAPSQNQSSDFGRPVHSQDWLRAGCPRTAEEAVVWPRQAVRDRLPHHDGTSSGHCWRSLSRK